jgi:hypothetical protein
METQSERGGCINRAERLICLGQEKQFGDDFQSQTSAFAIA